MKKEETSPFAQRAKIQMEMTVNYAGVSLEAAVLMTAEVQEGKPFIEPQIAKVQQATASVLQMKTEIAHQSRPTTKYGDKMTTIVVIH